MSIYEKCLALCFSLMIFAQAYLVRRYVGTWLFPACLFGLFWFGYTFIPLAILFSVPVEPRAIGFILLCALSFSIGSLPFDWRKAYKRNALKRGSTALVYSSLYMKVAFYVSTLAALVFLVLNLLDQGFSLHDLIFDSYASAAAYANMLYSETLNDNIFERLCLVCTYLGAMLGGLLFPCSKTRIERRSIIVLSFLPSVLVAVTQSGKGLLFLCVAFFYAGLLVFRLSEGTLRLFEKSSIRPMLLYMAVLIAVVTSAFLSRGLYTIEDVDVLIDRLGSYYASYAFSHIYAFSDWFAYTIGRPSEFAYSHENATYGFYTFMALFRMLGSDKEVPLGVFEEFYSHKDLLIGNIYTMFRGLILDFGIAGSVSFMLVVSVLFHLAFRAMLLNKRPVFTVAVFVSMLGFFYLSFIISLLSWKRMYAAFALLWVVLQFNRLMTRSDARQLAPGCPRVAVDQHHRV